MDGFLLGSKIRKYSVNERKLFGELHLKRTQGYLLKVEDPANHTRGLCVSSTQPLVSMAKFSIDLQSGRVEDSAPTETRGELIIGI
ncbi:MAG: hypothetical protein AAFO91_20235, partial [Bacteroidota bacterium]